MSKPATRSWITSIIASSPSTPARALYKYEILKSRLRSVAAPCANRGRQSAPGPTRKRASQHHGVTDLLPTAHHLAPKPERAPKPVSFNEVGPWPVPTRNDGSTGLTSSPLPRHALGRLPAVAPEQRTGDRLPFLVERRPADRLAGATVPIGGVAGVAFLAMQIGVDPIALPALVSLCGFVRAVPIAARVKPQRAQSRAQIRRRRSEAERGAEGGKVHAREVGAESARRKACRRPRGLGTSVQTLSPPPWLGSRTRRPARRLAQDGLRGPGDLETSDQAAQILRLLDQRARGRRRLLGHCGVLPGRPVHLVDLAVNLPEVFSKSDP